MVDYSGSGNDGVDRRRIGLVEIDRAGARTEGDGRGNDRARGVVAPEGADVQSGGGTSILCQRDARGRHRSAIGHREGVTAARSADNERAAVGPERVRPGDQHGL